MTITRRIDFARFMVEAVNDASLIHQVPVIVSCNAPSVRALAATAASDLHRRHAATASGDLELACLGHEEAIHLPEHVRRVAGLNLAAALADARFEVRGFFLALSVTHRPLGEPSR